MTPCILCGCENTRRYPAEISPFLKERVPSLSSDVQFVYCNDCGFSFYIPRPSEEQLALLYRGYRDTAYQIQRQKFETGYTQEVNAFFIDNKEEITTRKKNMMSILTKWHDVAGIKSVLDFGGDKGQYIPDEFSDAERCVYDPSGVRPLEGIRSVGLDSDKKFDLIMCCNVLEHVADPNEIMRRMISHSHGKTIFYIEVPNDSPLRTTARKIFFNFSFLRKGYNVMHGRRADDPRLIMHEHINCFSGRSLVHFVFNNHLIFEDINETKTVISCLFTGGRGDNVVPV